MIHNSFAGWKKNCHRQLQSSLLNFNGEAHMLPYTEHLFPFTRNVPCSRGSRICSAGESSLLNYNSEAHMLPLRTGPEHLFPFTRNVPCSRGSRICSSGESSLLNYNSEADMLPLRTSPEHFFPFTRTVPLQSWQPNSNLQLWAIFFVELQ